MSTAQMDLLHIDFTSIELTLELNRPPKVANILVFRDHFTKHIMVYMTPNQTAKTITKFFLSGLHLNLWGSGQTPKWLWFKLHEQHYWWDVQTPQHEEIAKHTLSTPDEWVSTEISSNYHVDD